MAGGAISAIAPSTQIFSWKPLVSAVGTASPRRSSVFVALTARLEAIAAQCHISPALSARLGSPGFQGLPTVFRLDLHNRDRPPM